MRQLDVVIDAELTPGQPRGLTHGLLFFFPSVAASVSRPCRLLLPPSRRALTVRLPPSIISQADPLGAEKPESPRSQILQRKHGEKRRGPLQMNTSPLSSLGPFLKIYSRPPPPPPCASSTPFCFSDYHRGGAMLLKKILLINLRPSLTRAIKELTRRLSVVCFRSV